MAGGPTGNTTTVIIEILKSKQLPDDGQFRIAVPLLITAEAMKKNAANENLADELPPLEDEEVSWLSSADFGHF
jgi:hypothetical protein